MKFFTRHGCIVWSGLAGFVWSVSLMLYILVNMGVIFYTPHADGSGDYYDLYHDKDSSWSIEGFLFLLLPLLMLFYPWLKRFIMMMLRKSRAAYFGLFVAKNSFFKVVSAILSIANVASIVFLLCKSEQEVNAIYNWRSDCNNMIALVSCPDNSDMYLRYLLAIILIWGGVNLFYALFGFLVSPQTCKGYE